MKTLQVALNILAICVLVITIGYPFFYPDQFLIAGVFLALSLFFCAETIGRRRFEMGLVNYQYSEMMNEVNHDLQKDGKKPLPVNPPYDL